MSHPDHRIESAQLRRSPRFGVFLIGGAVVGIVVAAALTLAYGGTEDKSQYTGVIYSSTQVFGFLALFCAPIGLALGGIVALILDRTVGRRTREVRIDRQTVTDDDSAPAGR